MNRIGRVLLFYVLPLLIAAGAVTALTMWFLRTYHRVEREETLPMIGEASYNPLYALRKILERDDVDAESRAKLNFDIEALRQRDTVVLYAEPHALTFSQSRQLLDWVNRGGHLVLQLPSSEYHNDKKASILDYLRVRMKTPPDESHAPDCGWRDESGDRVMAAFCDEARRFELPERALVQWGDDEAGLVFARIAHGRGQVDVWHSLEFLSSSRLKQDANDQELALQTLAPNYRQGKVYLIYAAQMPTLWRTLLQKGWPVWLPLGLGLFAWLWRRMQRFGPWLPSPLPERRSLLEHVDASGEFLFRHDDAGLLYTALRDSFMARLRWRDPLAAALSGEAQEDAIAQRLRRSRAYVHEALKTPAANDRHAYLERVRRLIHMRNLL
ncbi:MAG: DUF4350 domain-containing protein [Xanthomonadaceae bacterium]|jgi:hypothetical protein|nr:DUF4350 domain-containing protein [Xanthomonadaceae bacterium]